MPTLDIALPLALLFVVTAAFFLNKRAEKRLKASVEQAEVKTKDKLMFVGVLAIVISTITITTFLNPENIFENVLLGIFLGSYTMLLFTLTYLFSDLKKLRAKLFSIFFGSVSIVAGIVSLLPVLRDSLTIFRSSIFFGLAIVCFALIIYEQKQTDNKKAKWYLAIQPPALFLMIFISFNILHTEGTLNIWFPYLLDVFGFTFAILIILYLNSLFSWKTVGIFAILLTLLDIILVFSGPMVAAADTFTGLGLPALIYLPNIPFIEVISSDGVASLALRGLGLGDFFFAGILAIQTFNKFGKKYAYAAIAAMVVSFGIWDAYLPDIFELTGLRGFPATVCIITGWIPIVLIGLFLHRKQKSLKSPQIESLEEII
ncbi:MAG: hypothetical protein LBE76_08170 [Nitrososphaerota archaeon]|jgi:hypothetical protein|nr:hypothetical protein [Nitrososphaerota archaeon]